MKKMRTENGETGQAMGFCPVGIEKPLGVSELGNALKVVLGKISGINQVDRKG